MNTTQNYELYIIFTIGTSADIAQAKIENFLKNIEASNINITREGERKLSYPIRRHQQLNQSGTYYLVNFDLDLTQTANINPAVNKFNSEESILRYILVNQTDFYKQKAKEKLNTNPEFTSHRDFNKGKGANKNCISKYLGLRAVDYKDIEYLSQFTSPYAKIFGRTRTGSSAKFQRKITTAIKRARHMALMPFTAKWLDN
jgi:small subunit ribosomal protein S18